MSRFWSVIWSSHASVPKNGDCLLEDIDDSQYLYYVLLKENPR